MAIARLYIDGYTTTLPSNATFNPEPTYGEFGAYYWYWDFAYNTAITVTMTCTNGYYFARKPNVTVKDASGYQIDLTTDSLNADSSVYAFAFDNGDEQYGDYAMRIEITQVDIVQKTPTPTGKGNFITYYKVNDDILAQLSQVVIMQQTSSSGTVDIVDLSQYITSLRSYPFDIAVSDPISIILGYSNTNIQAPVANEIYHSINFGNVTLASTNGNINDYNVDIKALLPYIGYVNLNAGYYAGQTINLTYEIDLRSGLFTANFSIDGTIIDIFTGKIGQDLPYKVVAQESISNWINPDIQDTYPLQASILTIWHDNMTSDIMVSTQQHESFIMSFDSLGLCQFDDIQLTNVIPSDIANEIRQLMTTGIII